MQGVYSYQLTVTDNAGAIGRDSINVTVNAAGNIAPTANAGSDITLTLPVNTTALIGSGTDPDGSIASYAWIKIAGPVTGTLFNANSAIPTAGSLVKGIYIYQLTVIDNAGAADRDTINITVKAALNIAPIANAGSDLTIFLPVDSVNLNGFGFDLDGTIVTYRWKVIRAPGLYTIANPLNSQTQIQELHQGIYELEFSVTDNNGAICADTLILTVGASQQVINPGQVNIYPNPVSTILNAEIKSYKGQEKILITFFDIRGIQVFQKMIVATGTINFEKIDLTGLFPGIYILQVNYENNTQIIKKVLKM